MEVQDAQVGGLGFAAWDPALCGIQPLAGLRLYSSLFHLVPRHSGTRIRPHQVDLHSPIDLLLDGL